MTPGLIVALLSLLPSDTRLQRTTAMQVAPLIHSLAAQTHLSEAILASVVFHESAFDPVALGAAGEMGLMQLHPKGRATYLCNLDGLDWYYLEPNLTCGVKLLVDARRRCGPDPAKYLSSYAGHGCVASRYSARVLETARELERGAARARERLRVARFPPPPAPAPPKEQREPGFSKRYARTAVKG